MRFSKKSRPSRAASSWERAGRESRSSRAAPARPEKRLMSKSTPQIPLRFSLLSTTDIQLKFQLYFMKRTGNLRVGVGDRHHAEADHYSAKADGEGDGARTRNLKRDKLAL